MGFKNVAADVARSFGLGIWTFHLSSALCLFLHYLDENLYYQEMQVGAFPSKGNVYIHMQGGCRANFQYSSHIIAHRGANSACSEGLGTPTGNPWA